MNCRHLNLKTAVISSRLRYLPHYPFRSLSCKRWNTRSVIPEPLL